MAAHLLTLPIPHDLPSTDGKSLYPAIMCKWMAGMGAIKYLITITCHVPMSIEECKHVPFHYIGNNLILIFRYHTRNMEYNLSPCNLDKEALWCTVHWDRTRILVLEGHCWSEIKFSSKLLEMSVQSNIYRSAEMWKQQNVKLFLTTYIGNSGGSCHLSNSSRKAHSTYSPL